MARQDRITLKNVRSDSTKKISGDTRNNWIEMLFVTKKRFRCFRKQTHIDTCKKRLKELESLGFEFGEFGFADNHVHFQVNIPKRYSVEETEIILKSETAKKMFRDHPGFRKRYPKGAFWSGYEHYQSIGLKNFDESAQYLRDQQKHHHVNIIDDRQQTLDIFPPTEEGKAEGVIGVSPISLCYINYHIKILIRLYMIYCYLKVT